MAIILGKRICVIGPSSSGKSTFSEKLGKKLGYPVLHLDLLRLKDYEK